MFGIFYANFFSSRKNVFFGILNVVKRVFRMLWLSRSHGFWFIIRKSGSFGTMKVITRMSGIINTDLFALGKLVLLGQMKMVVRMPWVFFSDWFSIFQIVFLWMMDMVMRMLWIINSNFFGFLWLFGILRILELFGLFRQDILLRIMQIMVRVMGFINLNLPTIWSHMLLGFTMAMFWMSGIINTDLFAIGKRVLLGKMKVV